MAPQSTSFACQASRIGWAIVARIFLGIARFVGMLESPNRFFEAHFLFSVWLLRRVQAANRRAR